MTLFLAGNSHVVALAAGLKGDLEGDRKGRVAGHDVTVMPLGTARLTTLPFSELRPDGVALTAGEYAQNLRTFAQRDVIDGSDTWGFLLVNHHARLFRNRMWRDHAPASLGARAGHTPLSDGSIRAMLLHDQRFIRQFFLQLLAANVDAFAISSPPPRRDHRAITTGVPAETVIHVDALGRRLWADWLSAHDLALVTPPPEANDSDGFLRPELAAQETPAGAPDAHHANADYGRLMLARIADHLEARTHG